MPKKRGKEKKNGSGENIYTCSMCGLAVTVGSVYSRDSVDELVCCNEPMTANKRR